ncbi:MAG: hypothetical protein ACTHQE_17905 [Thermomicrobiales bacterium]
MDGQLPDWATSLRKIAPDDRVPDPPAGHVWLEWVGEASPTDNPVVQFNMVLRRYTPEQMDMIRTLARRRIARVENHTRRIFKQGNGYGELPHLSVPALVFGPSVKVKPGEFGSFIQAVTFRDADIIKGSICGHEFRIWREHDGEPELNVNLPNGSITLAKPEQFADTPEGRMAFLIAINGA